MPKLNLKDRKCKKLMVNLDRKYSRFFTFGLNMNIYFTYVI